MYRLCEGHFVRSKKRGSGAGRGPCLCDELQQLLHDLTSRGHIHTETHEAAVSENLRRDTALRIRQPHTRPTIPEMATMATDTRQVLENTHTHTHTHTCPVLCSLQEILSHSTLQSTVALCQLHAQLDSCKPEKPSRRKSRTAPSTSLREGENVRGGGGGQTLRNGNTSNTTGNEPFPSFRAVRGNTSECNKSTEPVFDHSPPPFESLVCRVLLRCARPSKVPFAHATRPLRPRGHLSCIVRKWPKLGMG